MGTDTGGSILSVSRWFSKTKEKPALPKLPAMPDVKLEKLKEDVFEVSDGYAAFRGFVEKLEDIPQTSKTETPKTPTPKPSVSDICLLTHTGTMLSYLQLRNKME